jgi:hypothetical protein
MENATMHRTAGLKYVTVLIAMAFGEAALAGPPGAPQQVMGSTSQPVEEITLETAKYACPMEAHPDESDPARQGAYLSTEPGECPRCGMKLRPIDDLAWVQARKAAQGGEVAYTCPDHQHVFAKTSGACPRCGRALEPFKVMYTCPDPQHAAVIRMQPGRCPQCRWRLAPFRGVWLSPDMADHNVPPKSELAEDAEYHCPLHPLVHSDEPGRCTICAQMLVAAGDRIEAAGDQDSVTIPPGAKYVCPMQECRYFASEPGRCAECGMRLKPIEEVEWARETRHAGTKARRHEGATTPGAFVCPMHPHLTHDAGGLCPICHMELVPAFVCPMHPDQAAPEPGACPICGMQLVDVETVAKPKTAPAAIRAQMNYLMEHYLALQTRFSSDRTDDVALHALGLVGAADEIVKHLDDPDVELPGRFGAAVRKLRGAALELTGKSLDDDRVTFVGLGGAMRVLVEHVRPSDEQYPKIYIFHCPMTKGDWLQTTDEMANPFYGFRMLKCGELQATQ